MTDYLKKYGDQADRIMQFYAGRRSYDEMLEYAAYAKLPSGKRHPHQYRLKKSALRKVHNRLKQYDLESCESFHELFETVHEAIAGINGIGEMMVYDTAHRIGAYLELEPEYVYLHAGTRVGAVALGFERSTAWIDPGDLPRAFRRLTAAQIEDCLCIYKRELQALNGG